MTFAALSKEVNVYSLVVEIGGLIKSIYFLDVIWLAILFEADIIGANFEEGWGLVVTALDEICFSAAEVTTETFLALKGLLIFVR